MKNIIHNDNGYIYESPDGGKTIYRRPFGESERECIQDNKNQYILELLEDIQYKVNRIKDLL